MQDLRESEESKKELKDSLVSKFKLDEERLNLKHQSEMNERLLEKLKNDLLIQSHEDKIKRLEGDIDHLKHKSKQYDNIAQSGIKSLISLNAFNERGLAR